MAHIEYDYSKLRGRIVEKYGSQESFADAVGIARNTLNLKLNNKGRFTQTQISEYAKILGINPVEIYAYFFARKVQ